MLLNSSPCSLYGGLRFPPIQVIWLILIFVPFSARSLVVVPRSHFSAITEAGRLVLIMISFIPLLNVAKSLVLFSDMSILLKGSRCIPFPYFGFLG